MILPVNFMHSFNNLFEIVINQHFLKNFHLQLVLVQYWFTQVTDIPRFI